MSNNNMGNETSTQNETKVASDAAAFIGPSSNNDHSVTDNKTGQKVLTVQRQHFPVQVSIIPEYSAIPKDDLVFSPMNALIVIQSGNSGEPRVPLHLAMCCDVSSSMAGTRITECRQAAHAVVDLLGDDDHLDIIIYNSQASILASGSKSDTNMLHSKIDTMTPSGTTDIGDALRLAYKTLGNSNKPKHTKRVFLFSDGEPTAGECSVEAFGRIASTFADRDFNVSTFGIGEGINSEIMMKIAEAGNGHYDFVSERRIQELTKKAFEGLSRLMGSRANLTLVPTNGVRFSAEKSKNDDAAASPDTQARQSTEIGEYTMMGDIKYDAITRFITRVAFDQVPSAGGEIVFLKAEFTFQIPDQPLAPPQVFTGIGKVTILEGADAVRSQRDPTVSVLITMRDCGLLFDKIDNFLERGATNDAIALLREVVSELEKHMDHDLDGMVHVQLRRSKRTLERLEAEGAYGARRAQLEIGHQRAAVRDRLSVCDFQSSDSSNRSCEFNRGGGGGGGALALGGSPGPRLQHRLSGGSNESGDDSDTDDDTGTDES